MQFFLQATRYFSVVMGLLILPCLNLFVPTYTITKIYVRGIIQHLSGVTYSSVTEFALCSVE